MLERIVGLIALVAVAACVWLLVLSFQWQAQDNAACQKQGGTYVDNKCLTGVTELEME